MEVSAIILKEQGYQIGSLVTQSIIDRCAREVISAYIDPILPTYDETDADVKNAVYCLSYILILQRNVYKTRFGAKEKNDKNSSNMPIEELEALTLTADMFIQKLKAKEGAESCPQIYDIAKIYNLNSLI